MGKRCKEQLEPPDESARAHCTSVERLLTKAIYLCDWNLSRRTCIASAGATDFRHSLVGVRYSPKKRRSKAVERLYKRGPFAQRFTYRTIMMTPRPADSEDYKFWLLVLAHELAHVVGLRTDTFRWGPGWTDAPWPQATTWTIGSASSDSEERIAERTAELITEWVGLDVHDDTWRVILGDIEADEVSQANFRLSFIQNLLLNETV